MKMKTGFVVGGLFLAAIGFAQKMDEFDAHVADYRLLLSKNVQKEVGISETQRTNLNKIADHERSLVQPYLEQLKKEHKDQRALQSDTKYLGFLMELRQKVLTQLTPKQLRRLRELSLQSVDADGIPAGVLDVIVSKKIGMSSAQLAKVRAVYQDGIKRTSTIVQAINLQITAKYKNTRVRTQTEADSIRKTELAERDAEIKKRKPELDVIERETKQHLQAVLTPKQIAAYHALEGKPFTVK